ncbi:4-diphosphocytidyl-2-C-methyl-D-erythritol kinase [Crocosphaera watsonii WH 0402]|uniref:4-diphosphocytidyl-2-C-methyl-D-erythritol kinase n=1 Tax=Crocosphaera watsonii WH 0402 TaxID=1284629 RepID=T2JRD1_CROWT|nr:4-diphosphocytidyl-2-C-methyl-D-erythritol kinase [Crocosphaera watsonii WH 0402]
MSVPNRGRNYQKIAREKIEDPNLEFWVTQLSSNGVSIISE